MLKKYVALAGLLVSSFPVTAIALWHQPVKALPVVDSPCYMVGGPGQTIDLSALCGQGTTNRPQPSAAEESANRSSLSFEQMMDSEGLTRWTSGRFDDVAYDVWIRRRSSGFYYFLWSMPAPEDRSNPEIIVYFDSNVSRLNRAFVLGCYFSYGGTCTGSGLSQAGYSERAIGHLIDDLSRISPHVRRRGPCSIDCINGFR